MPPNWGDDSATALVQLIDRMPQKAAAIDQLKLEFVERFGRPLELRGNGGLVRRLRKNYSHVLRVLKGDLSGKLYLSTVMDGPALYAEPLALSCSDTAALDERSDQSELESLRRR